MEVICIETKLFEKMMSQFVKLYFRLLVFRYKIILLRNSFELRN